MVVNHMAKVPLGALNERSTGNIKTVLNEDIEKLELFLAHNLPELVYYMIGPIAVFFLSVDRKYSPCPCFACPSYCSNDDDGSSVSEHG